MGSPSKIITTLAVVACIGGGVQAGVICISDDPTGPKLHASLEPILAHRSPLFAQAPFEADPFARIIVAELAGMLGTAGSASSYSEIPSMIIDPVDWLNGQPDTLRNGESIGSFDWMAALSLR